VDSIAAKLPATIKTSHITLLVFVADEKNLLHFFVFVVPQKSKPQKEKNVPAS
jgi:hypothetical protein